MLQRSVGLRWFFERAAGDRVFEIDWMVFVGMRLVTCDFPMVLDVFFGMS